MVESVQDIKTYLLVVASCPPLSWDPFGAAMQNLGMRAPTRGWRMEMGKGKGNGG